ncbi:MAG: YceI family protein [Sphingobium sp.]
MPQRYSLVAITLHWLIAALLAFQISVGWALEDLGARGFALFQLHKSVGIAILALSLLRVAVRWWKPRPAKSEGGWQGMLASGVHLGLYVFMIGAPFTGWALVSTARVQVPTLLFGVLPLPHLPLPSTTHDFAQGAHGVLAWIGIALLALHVAGALRHHLLIRDGLLWRIMPTRAPLFLVALPALLIIGFALGRLILPAVPPHAQARIIASEGLRTPPPDETKETAPAPNNAESTGENTAVAANEQEEAQSGPPPTWRVAPGGRIEFSVGNGGETIDGGFAKWTARIAMDPEHPESADIAVTIDLTSASVGDAYKDGMIVGEDFFATAASPTARFVARGAERVGTGSYRASGRLTLKDVTRPQTIRFTLSGQGAKRKVSGTATIARLPFGIGTGESGAALDKTVSVRFAFDATRE